MKKSLSVAFVLVILLSTLAAPVSAAKPVPAPWVTVGSWSLNRDITTANILIYLNAYNVTFGFAKQSAVLKLGFTYCEGYVCRDYIEETQIVDKQTIQPLNLIANKERAFAPGSCTITQFVRITDAGGVTAQANNTTYSGCLYNP